MSLQEEDLVDVTVSDGRKLVPSPEKAHKSHYIFCSWCPNSRGAGAGVSLVAATVTLTGYRKHKGHAQELEWEVVKGWWLWGSRYLSLRSFAPFLIELLFSFSRGGSFAFGTTGKFARLG